MQGMPNVPVVTHICTDSREADETTLFCAMPGERVDGHDYMGKAAALGCRAFLCERLPEALADMACAAILVPDTVKALSCMACARREEMDRLPVVAVTGSVGKTTTKEMIHAVLSSVHEVFKKDGNYNSTIGLPLSFLEISPDMEGAVLEMGMSSRGEISAMTSAVRPDIGIVANVGSSHMEYLGSRENIARAKLEIAEGIRENGVLLINGDEPLLRCLGQDFEGEKPMIPEKIRILRLSLAGDERADFCATDMAVRDGGMSFDLSTPEGVWTDLWIPAIGEHLVWAASFAAATGYLLGLREGQVKAGLASYKPAAMRQNIRSIAGVTLIEDCYNAAPESMGAALRVLNLTWATRRIAVLGDMKELGGQTEQLHKKVGAEAVRQGIDGLVAIGELGGFIAQGAMEAGLPADVIHHVPSAEEYLQAGEWLTSHLQPGDCVLFKASRSMALETLVKTVAESLEHSNRNNVNHQA